MFDKLELVCDVCHKAFITTYLDYKGHQIVCPDCSKKISKKDNDAKEKDRIKA